MRCVPWSSCGRMTEMWGWPAWLVWLFIHLLYLVEFQNRLVVLVRWAFQFLTFQRSARLITRSAEPAHETRRGLAESLEALEAL